MGCAPSFLSDQKDGNILFCINFRRTRRRCSLQNGNDVLQNDDINNTNFCNQSLLNPMQIKNESDYDKISSGKKDSIVTVAALGNLAGFNTIHTVVRRTTGSTGTSSSSGRLGHRKSSLALTPEDESMDTNNQVKHVTLLRNFRNYYL